MAAKKSSTASKRSAPVKRSEEKQRAKNQYIKNVLSSKYAVPVLLGALELNIILLIIAAFFIGVLLTKLQLAGNSSPTVTQGTNASSAPFVDKPLHIASSIGINPAKFKQCLTSGKYSAQVSSDLKLGQSAGVNGTPSFFINGNLLVGAQPYSAFQTAIDQELANPNTPLPSTTPTTVDVTSSKFSSLGNANAPVTVVEFADFQCPYCKEWFQQTLPQIISNYVDQGKVKMIFQNYAFLGADSTTAAQGAYCANEQGAFWKYYNFMYKHQGQEDSGWASQKNLL